MLIFRRDLLKTQAIGMPITRVTIIGHNFEIQIIFSDKQRILINAKQDQFQGAELNVKKKCTYKISKLQYFDY